MSRARQHTLWRENLTKTESGSGDFKNHPISFSSGKENQEGQNNDDVIMVDSDTSNTTSNVQTNSNSIRVR